MPLPRLWLLSFSILFCSAADSYRKFCYEHDADVCQSVTCEHPEEKLHIVVTSLMLENNQSRLEYIKENLKVFPKLEIWRSINGYDLNETALALMETMAEGIGFNNMDYPHTGMLATMLTKRYAFKHQVCCEYEYMVLIEDDNVMDAQFLEVYDGYIKKVDHGLETMIPGSTGAVCNSTSSHEKNKCVMRKISMWGDGYFSSLEGARRMLKAFQENALDGNVDNYINTMVGVIDNGEAYLHRRVHWNTGDIMKTAHFYYNRDRKALALDFKNIHEWQKNRTRPPGLIWCDLV